MASVWEVVAEGGAGSPPPVDWPALKREIVAKLDIEAEYAALGVEFTKPRATAKGWRECHAVGRKDDVASAAVNVVTGVYHDNGGEGLTLGIFDFALRFGEDFGRWSDVLKHFADKAGVDIRGIPSKSGGRVEEAHYDYRDSDGEVRYRIWRYRLPNGKKTFTQHPPDGTGLAGSTGPAAWTASSRSPTACPNCWPRRIRGTRSSSSRGRRTPTGSRAEGLVATTNHGGRKHRRPGPTSWPPSATATSSSCPTTTPGRAYPRPKVAGYAAWVARSVKVLELPGPAPKGDVSDWLDQGTTPTSWGGSRTRPRRSTPWTPAGATAPADDDLSRDATVADLRKPPVARPGSGRSGSRTRP
jgi:hypothetical protein